MSPRPFLSVADVALQLNVSERTVKRMIADGLRVYHLRKRTTRIHPDDLERFLWACAAKDNSGGSRSRSKGEGLAQRLGPAKKRNKSKPSTAEIVPFPGPDSPRNAA